MERIKELSGIKVSVLGCGWLGFPLAKRLIKEGYAVKGSTTSPKKLETLKRSGIKSYLINYPSSSTPNPTDFFNADVLFLNIPFRRDLADPNDYAQQIKSVIKDIRSSPIKHVIFASSTAVYPESLKRAQEDIDFTPADARARVLFDTEQFLLNQKGFKATIIRFGGLYGEDRPVGKFLAGKSGLKDPNKRVNLIHLDDCIEIVTSIIKKNIGGEIFNAVSDEHPTREKLYTEAAKRQGLVPPVFTHEDTQEAYKIVHNDKLKERLRYTFIHPDPSKG